MIPITAENIIAPDLESPWYIPNFRPGDVIILDILYNPYILKWDEAWNAQIVHYRYGIIIDVYSTNEEFLPAPADNMLHYLGKVIDAINLQELHDYLYPEVIPPGEEPDET